MKTPIILLTLLLISCSTNRAFSQELEADGYKISIKAFSTRMAGMHSKRRPVSTGTFKVKAKDGQKGTYHFTFLELGDEVTLFTLKDEETLSLNPKLIYNNKEGIFVYGSGSEEEKEEEKKMISQVKTREDLVLIAMLIWLKLDK